MTIELNGDQQRILEHAVKSGHFRSVEEALDHAFRSIASPPRARPEGKKSLAQLFRESPWKGLNLEVERTEETSRPVDL